MAQAFFIAWPAQAPSDLELLSREQHRHLCHRDARQHPTRRPTCVGPHRTVPHSHARTRGKDLAKYGKILPWEKPQYVTPCNYTRFPIPIYCRNLVHMRLRKFTHGFHTLGDARRSNLDAAELTQRDPPKSRISVTSIVQRVSPTKVPCVIVTSNLLDATAMVTS